MRWSTLTAAVANTGGAKTEPKTFSLRPKDGGGGRELTVAESRTLIRVTLDAARRARRS